MTPFPPGRYTYLSKMDADISSFYPGLSSFIPADKPAYSGCTIWIICSEPPSEFEPTLHPGVGWLRICRPQKTILIYLTYDTAVSPILHVKSVVQIIVGIVDSHFK
jgi:hypothetical protein